MNPDSFNLYQYGDKFKLVYFKSGNNPRIKKSRFEALAKFYEENACFIPHMRNHFSIDELELLYEEAYDCHRKLQKTRHYEPSESDVQKSRLSQSICRSKARITEYALCNDFTFFCTFTLSEDKRDRFDLKVFSKDFGQFIRNFNRSRSSDNHVKYVIIPEKHQDGAWHAHGFLMGLSSDELIVNEHGYYEWLAYSKRFGFLNMSPIRDKNACSFYIRKYITKDFATANREACGHLFFASQGLNKRSRIMSCDADGSTFSNPSFKADFENDYLKISWFDSLDDVSKIFNLEDL